MLFEIHIVNMWAGRKNAIVEDEIKNKHYKFLLLHEVLWIFNKFVVDA